MSAPSLQTDLGRIGQLQPHLPAAASLLLAAGAAAAVTVSGIWPMVRHVSVIAHEGAHAVMGSGLGHRVTAVTLSASGGGATSIPTIAGRGPSIATAIVGYLGPSLFGLGAAKLISAGHVIEVIWLALLALAVVVPLLRGTFSWLAVLLTGGLLYLVARYAAVGAQVAVAYGIAWFLLLAGVRVVLERGAGADDAARLRQLTRIPRGFWSGVWLACTVAALALGGALLL